LIPSDLDRAGGGGRFFQSKVMNEVTDEEEDLFEGKGK
jgi:hypothetical protein